VLIVDAADYLAKKDPAFFADLQDFAKVCADVGTLRVAFVSSEGTALPLMQASSAWSRALAPFEVQDIADDEAVAYLVGRGVGVQWAQEAVRTVTWGRFALLLTVGEAGRNNIAPGSSPTQRPSVAAIRSMYHAGTDATLKDLGLSRTHAFFSSLCLSPLKRVTTSAARDELRKAELDALLRANVIAMHPDNTFSFHSRHVESFFQSTI